MIFNHKSNKTMIISKRKDKKTIFKYMKFPIRILARARDISVKSLTGCGPNIAYGNSMGCPTPQMPSIPRNLSIKPQSTRFRTVDEDLPELIRLSSIKPNNRGGGGGGGGGERGVVQRWNSMPAGKVGSAPGPLVVFGRIDEEGEDSVFGYEDGDHDGVGLLMKSGVYARSQSYAVVLKRK